jgi:hypothetical protein
LVTVSSMGAPHWPQKACVVSSIQAPQEGHSMPRSLARHRPHVADKPHDARRAIRG